MLVFVIVIIILSRQSSKNYFLGTVWNKWSKSETNIAFWKPREIRWKSVTVPAKPGRIVCLLLSVHTQQWLLIFVFYNFNNSYIASYIIWNLEYVSWILISLSIFQNFHKYICCPHVSANIPSCIRMKLNLDTLILIETTLIMVLGS